MVNVAKSKVIDHFFAHCSVGQFGFLGFIIPYVQAQFCAQGHRTQLTFSGIGKVISKNVTAFDLANLVSVDRIIQEKSKIGIELELVFDVIKLVAKQIAITEVL